MSHIEHLSQSVKSLNKQTKAYFHGDQWKEALVFFFFVLLAFGFWLLQSLQQEYEISLTFPVKYKELPADIAFDEEIPQQIMAKVKDKGSVLLNYTLGRTLLPIEVKLDNKEKQGVLHFSKKQIENDIQKQLLATTSLIEFEPQQIEAFFSQRKHKALPVKFVGDIQFITGFHLSDEIQIQPNTVDAYASAATLDTLYEAQTSVIEVKKGNKTVQRTIALRPIPGVNLVPSTVTVTLPIEEYTEKSLTLPIICKGVPHHYKVRLFPPEITVTCSVPLSRFKALSEAQFEVAIDYQELEQNASGSCIVHLTRKPEWVHTPTLLPMQVEFLLEHNEHYD